MYSLYDPIFLFMLFVLSVCISVVGMNVDFWVVFFSWQFYHCQLIVTSCYIFPSTNLKHNYIQRGKNATWNKLPFIFFVVVSVFSTKSQMPCDFLVVSFPDGSSIRNWKILKSLFLRFSHKLSESQTFANPLHLHFHSVQMQILQSQSICGTSGTKDGPT